MSKKSVIQLFSLLIIIVSVWFIYTNLYNKPHRQIASEEAQISLQASELFNAYSSDEVKADSLYLNKVLQVQGVVEKILTHEQGITLVLAGAELFGVSCTLAESEKQKADQIKVGSTISLKGLCNGMLMDVVLVKCVLLEERAAG